MAQQAPPPRRPSRLPGSGRGDFEEQPGGYPDEAVGQRDVRGNGPGRRGRHSAPPAPQDRGPQAPRDRDTRDPLDRDTEAVRERSLRDPHDPRGWGQQRGPRGRAGRGQDSLGPDSLPAWGPDERPEWPADSGQHARPSLQAQQAQQAERSRRAGRADSAQRGGRPAGPGRSDRDSWRQHDPFTDDDESELPPWAGLSIQPARPGGTRLRPPPDAGPGAEPADTRPRRRRRGRAAAARLRKSRRRVQIWCGTAIAIAVVVAAIAEIHGLGRHTAQPTYISTLQAGEFRAVPSACKAVSPALLSKVVPGSARKVTPADTSATASQCSFTVDAKPVFRVLEVTLQAYQPSLVAAGDGSATDNAADAFQSSRQQLAHPGKKSPLPPAQVTALPGLGSQAISALQVIRSGKTVTDLVTVMARDHNVLLTVSLQAQAAGGGYGPVSVATVRAGAESVGRAVMAKAAAEPAVKA